VTELVRAALIAPAYLSVAWTLMVSYQLFTETAVKTVLGSIETILPDMWSMLYTRVDMIVFVYAFAWVFVLSSAIPSIILGKSRSIIAQFIVCLVLTLSAFIVIDSLNYFLHFNLIDSIITYAGWFTNPIFALFYLSLPYVFMLTIDFRARKKYKNENTKWPFSKKSKNSNISADSHTNANTNSESQPSR
jgi:hypothetical protein